MDLKARVTERRVDGRTYGQTDGRTENGLKQVRQKRPVKQRTLNFCFVRIMPTLKGAIKTLHSPTYCDYTELD